MSSLPLPATGAAPRLRADRLDKLALWAFVVVAILLELPLRSWWVDDAAISFSYARNWANGDGLVPYPGGERVEGFSDPLWVALLALGWRLGVSPFTLSKVMGAACAAATVPLAWAIARRIPAPERYPFAPRSLPLVAAALAATNAQLAIWSSSGLENGLFAMLLALGLWRLLVEAEHGGPPGAALAFLGLSLTRPEGVVYGAFGLAFSGIADVLAGRRGRAVASLCALALPLAAYHAARYAYFAFPFSTTYYVKVVHVKFDLFAWGSRSWRYLRRWSYDLGWMWYLPLFICAVAGTRGLRGRLGLALTVALVAVLVLPDTSPFVEAKVVTLIAAAVAFPLLATGRPGWPARVLCAASCMLVLAWAVRAVGDWMHGYRWLSFLVAPMSVLYAVGFGELVARTPRRYAGHVALLLAATPPVVHVAYTVKYAASPAKSVYKVRSRVARYDALARTLRLHRPWVAADTSQGGMTWWAPPSRAIDGWGLTDMRFALHKGKAGFRPRYVLDPPRFDFAHVTDERGTLRTEPTFRRAFVEVDVTRDPEKAGAVHHSWTWVRRDLLVAEAWPAPSARVVFVGGPTLEGISLRAPQVAAASGLFVELGLRRSSPPRDFVVELVLEGPGTAVLPVAPGYGKLFPPASWHEDEVFVGRYALALPKDLPLGRYTVEVRVRDADGKVLTASGPPGRRGEPAPGPTPGWRLPDVVEVVSTEDARVRAEADWTRASTAATTGDCAAADDAWLDAAERLPLDRSWESELLKRALAPLSACWAARADLDPDVPTRLDDLRHARRWDVRSPTALAAGARLADALEPLAEAARRAGDLDEVLRLEEAIVEADPRRAWARRHAEDARTALLARGGGAGPVDFEGPP